MLPHLSHPANCFSLLSILHSRVLITCVSPHSCHHIFRFLYHNTVRLQPKLLHPPRGEHPSNAVFCSLPELSSIVSQEGQPRIHERVSPTPEHPPVIVTLSSTSEPTCFLPHKPATIPLGLSESPSRRSSSYFPDALQFDLSRVSRSARRRKSHRPRHSFEISEATGGGLGEDAQS